MSVVLAIDAGTTGVRSFALREDGSAAGFAYREFTQHFPRPGWVEHDPVEIWNAVQETLAELVGRLDEPVAAIGITDQRETIVAWDRRTGRPLHRAIVWQDRRTAARCDALREQGVEPLVRAVTGLVLDPYFSATKVEWLLSEGGVAVSDDLALGTVDAWVLWNLTGGPQAGCTPPSRRTPAAPCSSTSAAWRGRTSCSTASASLSAALPEVRPSSGAVQYRTRHPAEHFRDPDGAEPDRWPQAAAGG